MEADLAAAALWGVVGGLSFLVLALGYRLVTPASPALPVVAVVAVLVTVTATAAAFALERRLRPNESA